MEKLGNAIKDWRIATGLTQTDLGVHIIGWEEGQSRLSKYENGHRIPETMTLFEICRALGITFDQLQLEQPPNHFKIPKQSFMLLPYESQAKLLRKTWGRARFMNIVKLMVTPQKDTGTVNPLDQLGIWFKKLKPDDQFARRNTMWAYYSVFFEERS